MVGLIVHIYQLDDGVMDEFFFLAEKEVAEPAVCPRDPQEIVMLELAQ
jgi:hypothetical protein